MRIKAVKGRAATRPGLAFINRSGENHIYISSALMDMMRKTEKKYMAYSLESGVLTMEMTDDESEHKITQTGGSGRVSVDRVLQFVEIPRGKPIPLYKEDFGKFRFLIEGVLW